MFSRLSDMLVKFRIYPYLLVHTGIYVPPSFDIHVYLD